MFSQETKVCMNKCVHHLLCQFLAHPHLTPNPGGAPTLPRRTRSSYEATDVYVTLLTSTSGRSRSDTGESGCPGHATRTNGSSEHP